MAHVTIPQSPSRPETASGRYCVFKGISIDGNVPFLKAYGDLCSRCRRRKWETGTGRCDMDWKGKQKCKCVAFEVVIYADYMSEDICDRNGIRWQRAGTWHLETVIGKTHD